MDSDSSSVECDSSDSSREPAPNLAAPKKKAEIEVRRFMLPCHFSTATTQLIYTQHTALFLVHARPRVARTPPVHSSPTTNPPSHSRPSSFIRPTQKRFARNRPRSSRNTSSLPFPRGHISARLVSSVGSRLSVRIRSGASPFQSFASFSPIRIPFSDQARPGQPQLCPASCSPCPDPATTSLQLFTHGLYPVTR